MIGLLPSFGSFLAELLVNVLDIPTKYHILRKYTLFDLFIGCHCLFCELILVHVDQIQQRCNILSRVWLAIVMVEELKNQQHQLPLLLNRKGTDEVAERRLRFGQV